jgi:hypothetical protein
MGPIGGLMDKLHVKAGIVSTNAVQVTSDERVRNPAAAAAARRKDPVAER